MGKAMLAAVTVGDNPDFYSQIVLMSAFATRSQLYGSRIEISILKGYMRRKAPLPCSPV